jgi:hypothetical protein
MSFLGISNETQLWNPTSGELLYKVTWNLDNFIIAFDPNGVPFAAGCSPPNALMPMPPIGKSVCPYYQFRWANACQRRG